MKDRAKNILRLVITGHLLGHGGQQGDEVRQGKADQVTVGGGVEWLGPPHRQDHHQVTKHSHQEYTWLEHRTCNIVIYLNRQTL